MAQSWLRLFKVVKDFDISLRSAGSVERECAARLGVASLTPRVFDWLPVHRAELEGP